MSWCTAAEVADLISVSRLRHDVAEAERKAADLRFIELHASAVNIGDALVEVAVASNAVSCGVRLAAALTLESLVTERAWCEGIGFSDKERVLTALLACLRDASLAASVTDSRLSALLCSCLCRIICFEYPAARWDTFIDECVSAVVSLGATEQQAGRGFIQRTLLLRLAEVCAAKAALWWRLASVVVRRLLAGAAVPGGAGEPRLLCLRVVLQLMRRRPRPGETTEAERPKSSFIFSDEFRGVVGRGLEEGAKVFESGVPRTILLEECGLLLDVAQHLLGDDALAHTVFRCAVCLLSSCEAAYLADDDDDRSLASCADKALECLVGVLQMHPEASLLCDSEKFLSTLFSYMTRAVALEHGEESALLDALQEDCVVPLGCAGGDTAANAGAALELLMEANPHLLGLAVGSLCATVTELEQGTNSAHWRAWTTALRCLCRVCDEKGLSLADSLPDAAGRLLSPLALLLRRTVDPLEAAEVIELLALCVVRAKQESVCRAFFFILEATFDDVGDTGTREQVLLLAVTVHAVHRFFSTYAPSLLPGSFCDTSAWLRRALAVIARGGPLAVYCGAHAVQTLLRVTPACTLPSASLVLAALDNACRQCNVPNASSLLAGLVWSLCRHAPGGCKVAVERLEIFLSHCLQNGPRRAELRRSLTDYLWRFLRSYLRQTECLQCVATVLHKCLPVVLQFAVEDAPHDDATTRLVSSCLAAAATCDHAGVLCENISSVLWELLRSAVQERHSSTALTKIAAAMSATALMFPTLLDGDMTAVVSLLFSNVDAAGAKGLNYAGCCLLPALFCVRHPEHLGDMAAAFVAAPRHKHLAWGTMLGLWSSVAPLTDHFTTLYFLAAWCRLLGYAVAARSEGQDALAVVVPHCTVYYLPSMYVKSLPKRRVAGCSVAQCIALGLALVAQRGQKSAKVKLLEEELLQPLSLNRRFEALACCSAAEAGIGALLSMSPAEGAHWLLGVMSAGGYGLQVDTALRFAGES
ncbi:uncharacterized protein Tco025E_08013 [Trypanosoma conorhini]|uniref:Uncharacterized protein n=1 Tax=Trypanosoma conorhini TaxID=83891 RepID=A0A3R7KLU2_9TRYP|nr:uncharacterized protein Tco025E_08013 [Trypanosoma conorhini]RNF04138.1 hypothetical protein Tco025E_08013 [Trypanosoma conorhini]